MPELPEVEIITRQLQKEVVGKYVKDAGPFSTKLRGTSIKEVSRIAKVILLHFDRSENLLAFHLGLTGRLLLRKPKDVKDPYLRLKIVFNDGYELRFCDMRLFGFAKLINPKQAKQLAEKYGPTPFTKGLDAKKFSELLARKTPIKKLLLDQATISGVGNIYANDALWMSRIHPQRQATTITPKEAETLLKSLQLILAEGLRHGGSTIRDFVDIYGNPGTHQKYFRVYGKNGRPCQRCKTIIEVVQLGGRGTFFCPSCQPLKGEAPKTCKLIS